MSENYRTRWTQAYAYLHALRFEDVGNGKEQPKCACGGWSWPELIDAYRPANRRKKCDENWQTMREARGNLQLRIASAHELHMEMQPELKHYRPEGWRND